MNESSFDVSARSVFVVLEIDKKESNPMFSKMISVLGRERNLFSRTDEGRNNLVMINNIVGVKSLGEVLE